MTAKSRDLAHWRTAEMARTLGLDLAAMLYSNRLDRQVYGDMVDACARCTWSEGCMLWVKTQSQRAAAAPGICANQTVLAELTA